MPAKLWNYLSLKTWWYSNQPANLFALTSATELIYMCNKFEGTFTTNFEKVKKCVANYQKTYKTFLVPECSTWARFAWLYGTDENIFPPEKATIYSKLLLMLFGENIVEENTDHIIFPRLSLWANFQINRFQETLHLNLGYIIESGNHYREFVAQRLALRNFLLARNTNYKGSLVSLLHIMISKNSQLGWSLASYNILSRSLSSSRDEYDVTKPATISDFRYIWISFGALQLFEMLSFVIELSWNN